MSRPPGDAVLDVRDLSVSFRTPIGELEAVRKVSFSIAPGEVLGMVGESGSGKSVTGLALSGLLPAHTSRTTGEVILNGRNVLGLPERQLARVRGREIAMIFQEPMSALDPVYRVGNQIAETVRAHEKVTRRAAHARAVDLLVAVGIPAPRRRALAYPFQLSGGMRQRVMIAIAIVANPVVLVADEPTTALDVTIQAQILDLLRALSDERGTAVLLITHDLGVVAETCTRLVTLYAGEVVEQSTVDEALSRPAHPYTSGLIASIPRGDTPKALLRTIPGRVPPLSEMPVGCRFHPRCAYVRQQCLDTPQPLQEVEDRLVRCCRHSELDLPGALAEQRA